jgi:hypothetical protein
MRADQLTAHIVDPVKRERVRKNLIKQFESLERITDPEDEPVETTEPYKDGCDNVPVVTLEDIEARERGRINNLRHLHRELQDDTVVIDVMDEVNVKGRHGYTPLHRAVNDVDVEAVRDLLGRNADPEIRDASGLTPLDRARLYSDEPGMARIIRILESA